MSFRSLSRGGALWSASVLKKNQMPLKNITQLNLMKQLLHVDRGAVTTIRRTRRRAYVCVLTCVQSSRSTNQSPLSAAVAGTSGSGSNAGSITRRIPSWSAVSKMQQCTSETSRQSVEQVASLLMRHSETCHAIIIPLSVRGSPTKTQPKSCAMATMCCNTAPTR